MSEKRTFDLHKAEDIDAMEANLNEVEPSWLEAERRSGLLWSLEIGRRRDLIARARAALVVPSKQGLNPKGETL